MAAHDIAVSDTGQPLGPLAERGWFLHCSEGRDSDATVRDLGKFGDRLGTRVAGRAGALEEAIELNFAALCTNGSFGGCCRVARRPLEGQLWAECIPSFRIDAAEARSMHVYSYKECSSCARDSAEQVGLPRDARLTLNCFSFSSSSQSRFARAMPCRRLTGQGEQAAGSLDAQLAVINPRQNLDPVQLALAHCYPAHAARPRCQREEVTFLLCSWVTF